MAERLIHVLGVPLDLGGARRGVDMGPSAVRIAGLGERLAGIGFTVVDKGNLDTPIPETRAERDPKKKYVREIARVCQKLYQQAYASLERCGSGCAWRRSLTRCGICRGIRRLRGHARQEIGLLWVDAHGDMNTPASTSTGNVHGMPLAALLGPEPAELSRIGVRSPKVRADKTVLIGIRNLDEPEKARILESHVHLFTMKGHRPRMASPKVMERALAIAGADTAGIHVSFDLDVCDPTIAPGVGTPVKGGLNYREAHMVMEMVADSGRLLALDLVEINPILDTQNQTAILGTELVLSAFGQRII
jgi:arginase